MPLLWSMTVMDGAVLWHTTILTLSILSDKINFVKHNLLPPSPWTDRVDLTIRILGRAHTVIAQTLIVAARVAAAICRRAVLPWSGPSDKKASHVARVGRDSTWACSKNSRTREPRVTTTGSAAEPPFVRS